MSAPPPEVFIQDTEVPPPPPRSGLPHFVKLINPSLGITGVGFAPVWVLWEVSGRRKLLQQERMQGLRIVLDSPRLIGSDMRVTFPVMEKSCEKTIVTVKMELKVRNKVDGDQNHKNLS